MSANAVGIRYPVRMYIPKLMMIALCCSVLHAQDKSDSSSTESFTTDPTAVLSESTDSWSLSKIKLRDTTIYWDNDGTLPNFIDDTDRYYTNGIGFELSFDPQLSADLEEKFAPAGEWENPRFGLGLAVKQMIFTGIDITDPSPATDDHPYGGYLYFAFSFQRADDQKHDHFELDLGVIGERSQAEAVQRFIHNVFPDEDTPQGWDHQLANEAAINFTFERTWKTKPGNIQGVGFEMLPAIGFDLGNVHTRVRTRLTLRAGLNLPSDFGPASLLGHKDHTVGNANWGEDDWSFYAYTTLGVDAVAWNIFLDGNTFANSRDTDSEALVAQATVGVVTRYKAVYLGWSQTFQTKEFEAQPNSQTWGSIAFGCSFDY